MSYQKIYLGTECRSAEEPLPGEQASRDNDVNGEPVEPPKVWDFKDPFVFAPPKPDRDPWSILLEPLMEKDKIQCEAWKDEVQNLLIFAGLFSAVVTAFIIESYKSLKPDPNDAIISLLSVIANRLDNTANSTLVFPTSTDGPSFSPNMSSIRVNTFWFISLVLSLATVLVGIISLQWIREHQNYPKLSPKETYALFNMRAEGLESWQIPKIFTALPLLLQSALVLFLSGIVDFLSSFGGIVVIPVGAMTTLILLFLVATTVLPGLQGSLLFLPYPYLRSSKTPAAPCPYKSPQAHAFRSVLRSIIRIGSKIFPGRQIWRKTHRFAAYIGMTWTGQRWAEFDMAWLRLRDAFARRSCGRLFEEHYYFEDVPVYDLACGLMASV
ncbi:hypothetical protein GALMADRAFT_134659 [Galerina marginata CBS 339.88]|uniref:DUF6535 domain-containing protein n=1 Tax=Galerina marginata (strain CBS 339.88) TaxID=685588 RepID=A0A067TLE2_GALM3|nr:hypothetical protein GALMADRAFT_134659 [Galerina marginata CBS 339.88]